MTSIVIATCTAFEQDFPDQSLHLLTALRKLKNRPEQHTGVDQRHPNGELHVDLPEEPGGRPVLLVQSLTGPSTHPDKALLALLATARCYRERGAGRITVFVPQLSYARPGRPSAEPQQPLLLTLLAALIGLGLIAGGSYSAWDTTQAAPNSGTITAATVTLDVADDTAGSHWTDTMDNALPGATQTGYIDLTNSSSIPLSVTGHLGADQSSTGLEAGLTLTVTESDIPFGSGDHSADVVVIDHANIDQTGQDLTTEKLDPAAKKYFEIVTELPTDADNALQGKAASYDLGFNGSTAVS